MRGVRVLTFVLLPWIVSGCAGGRARQDVARLQAQLNVLDERVNQLERSGMPGPQASLMPDALPEAGTTAIVPPTPSKHQTSSKAGAKTSSLKPTTREAQQALKNAGFYQGAVDGKMGAMTREAIKEFQRVHGLTDDGVVGKQTWAKLRAYADLSANPDEATAAENLK